MRATNLHYDYLKTMKFNIPDYYKKDYYTRRNIERLYLYRIKRLNQHLKRQFSLGVCYDYEEYGKELISVDNNIVVPLDMIHSENGVELTLTEKLILLLPCRAFHGLLRNNIFGDFSWLDGDELTIEDLENIDWHYVSRRRTIGKKTLEDLMRIINYVLEHEK